MTIRQRVRLAFVALLLLPLVFSCAKSGKKAENAPADTTRADTTLSYVSREVSFGVFFDAEGVKRTIKLGSRDRQTTIYIIVNFPETMPIAAVEYRLVLPPEVKIENDVYYNQRVALLGTFDEGISETFPCVPGPKLVLHALTLSVPPGLKNAEIALLAHARSDFIGIAQCDEGQTMVPATSFKAVINPTE
ncbi:MAG: hypothetical protein NTW97_03920 [Candidatus Krumholzibacteria bacterium]|nr:hypothetical protein [Candidatus Krumholzibacteria bacterium]